MKNIESVLEKASVGSILIAALSCAGCFPALGSLAAAIGLGFLGQLEGVMINKLLPVFAGFALLLSIYSWSKHRIHWRGLISTLPPIVILAVLYPLWKYAWSMFSVSWKSWKSVNHGHFSSPKYRSISNYDCFGS